MHDQDKIELIRVIIFISLLMILTALFFFVLVLKYQKKQIIHTKKILEIEKENELKILRTELQVQETTFQHISREIHDNIGQKLTLVKLNLSNMQTEMQGSAFEVGLAELAEMVTVALDDLRDLSRSMSAEMIRQNGLVKAVEFEIQQINKPGRYNMKLIVTGDVPFMDANIELNIFRMIQEALSNILKHADATQVEVAVSGYDHELQIRVVDNGCGFNLEEVQHRRNGLSNITTRADAMNGKVSIDSTLTKGTQVIISIPII